MGGKLVSINSSALGIDKSVDIIQHIRSLPTLKDRADAVSKVQTIERAAMKQQVPQPGLVQLMDYLRSKGMKTALCTRNFEYVAQGKGGEFLLLRLNTCRSPISEYQSICLTAS